MISNETFREKKWMRNIQKYESNQQQLKNCLYTAIQVSSHKPAMRREQNILGSIDEIKTNSKAIICTYTKLN